jgi:uncharacterized protein (UPF0335 family)
MAESDDAEFGFAAAELKQFIERIQRLEEEKSTIAGDIKDVYAELKGRGLEPKTVKKVIALLKKDKDERQEEDAILETYMRALGMFE